MAQTTMNFPVLDIVIIITDQLQPHLPLFPELEVDQDFEDHYLKMLTIVAPHPPLDHFLALL